MEMFLTNTLSKFIKNLFSTENKRFKSFQEDENNFSSADFKRLNDNNITSTKDYIIPKYRVVTFYLVKIIICICLFYFVLGCSIHRAGKKKVSRKNCVLQKRHRIALI